MLKIDPKNFKLQSVGWGGEFSLCRRPWGVEMSSNTFSNAGLDLGPRRRVPGPPIDHPGPGAQVHVKPLGPASGQSSCRGGESARERCPRASPVVASGAEGWTRRTRCRLSCGATATAYVIPARGEHSEGKEAGLGRGGE